jgi:excisionase family DNA binding protein
MLIRTEQMAENLGVSIETLREWVKDGRIPVMKITRRTWMFDPADVEKKLKELYSDGVKPENPA